MGHPKKDYIRLYCCSKIMPQGGTMHKIKMTAIFLLAMTIVAGCSGNADLLREKDRQITTLNEKIRTLKAELAATKAGYEQLQQEDSRHAPELAKAKKLIHELEKKLDRLTSRYTDEKTRADQLHEKLEKALAAFKEKEAIQLARTEDATVVTAANSVMFSSGSAALTKEAQGILDSIMAVVREDPTREIKIEGHTDNTPIAAGFRYRYRSNWELSLSRALSVLHYLRKTHQVKPSRLAAIGYGEFRPVAENTTQKGRAANRRVVISIGRKLSPM